MFSNLVEPDDDRAVLVSVPVAPGRAELVADRLFSCGATGIEERTDRLVAGFGNRAAALVAIESLDPEDRADVLVEIPDDTWFDGWRAYARPQRAGRLVVVRPAWVPYSPRPGDLVVDVDPGRAFGSGAHATTRLVLAELERRVVPGRTRVVDVGSGSGVLAVTAALLGAPRVVATDIEPAAREATAANAARNGVSVDVVPDLPGGGFDLAVANIGAATLIELAPRLEPLAPVLVLAGFLVARSGEVAAAYPARTVTARSEEDGWVALTLEGEAATPISSEPPT